MYIFGLFIRTFEVIVISVKFLVICLVSGIMKDSIVLFICYFVLYLSLF